MGPPKGKSNNPNGRPPIERSLTQALRQALGEHIFVDGKNVTRKDVVSGMVARALAEGRVKFPEDTGESIISVKDWIDLAKWVYQYLEPPTTKTEVTGADGAPLMPKFDLSGLTDAELKQLKEIREKIESATHGKEEQ